MGSANKRRDAVLDFFSRKRSEESADKKEKSKPKSKTTLSDLPLEMLEKVGSFLPVDDLVGGFSQVCYPATQGSVVWRTLDVNGEQIIHPNNRRFVAILRPNAKHIQHLRIQKYFAGSILDRYFSCPGVTNQLQSLELFECRIFGDIFGAMSNRNIRLKELILDQTMSNNRDASDFRCLSSLRTLIVKQGQGFYQDDTFKVRDLVKFCTMLERVNFDLDIPEYSPLTYQRLLYNNKETLTKLTLKTSNTRIDIAWILTRLINLTHISIDSMENFRTALDFQAMGMARQLISFEMTSSEYITPLNARQAARTFGGLKLSKLENLSWDRITSEAFRIIFDNCPNLKSVSYYDERTSRRDHRAAKRLFYQKCPKSKKFENRATAEASSRNRINLLSRFLPFS